MIRDYLIPAIKEQFPNEPFTFGGLSGPIASLRSPCECLGSLEIHDDGDEATVYFVNATHSHFSCYDEKLTQQEKEKLISSDVMEFLEALFKDRVVVWRMFGGLAGGWRLLRAGEEPPVRSMTRQQFLWSKGIK